MKKRLTALLFLVFLGIFSSGPQEANAQGIPEPSMSPITVSFVGPSRDCQSYRYSVEASASNLMRVGHNDAVTLLVSGAIAGGAGPDCYTIGCVGTAKYKGFFSLKPGASATVITVICGWSNPYDYCRWPQKSRQANITAPSRNPCEGPPPGGGRSGGSPNGGGPDGGGPGGDSGRGGPLVQTTGGDPVDLFTGRFVFKKTDLFVSDTLPISMTRFFRDGDLASRSFGVGMTHSYDISLSIEIKETSPLKQISLIFPDGAIIPYTAVGTSGPGEVYEHTGIPSEYYKSRLAVDGDKWILTLKSGMVYTFLNEPSACPFLPFSGGTGDRSSGDISGDGAVDGSGGGPEGGSGDGEFITITTNVVEDHVLPVPALTYHSRNCFTGALESIRDRFGNTVSITRDSSIRDFYTGSRRITQITSPNGRWIKLYYRQDQPMNIISNNTISYIEDNIGRKVFYASNGWWLQVHNGDRQIQRYFIDENEGRLLRIEDGKGIQFLINNEYDRSGRITNQLQSYYLPYAPYLFTYKEDGSGKVIQTDVTDPRGIKRRVTFNADGYIVTDTRAVDTPEEQTTLYEREPVTNLILSTTDKSGRKTAYTYNAFGNVKTITQRADIPNNNVTTTFEYHPEYNLISKITDPLNHDTLFHYESPGNLKEIIDATQRKTEFRHNLAGQIERIIDSEGNVSKFGYSFSNSELKTTAETIDPSGNSLGNITERTFDVSGRLTSLTGPPPQLHRTVYEYNDNLIVDKQGCRLNSSLKVTDPLLGLTQFEYDANGNLCFVTDAKTNATSYRVDMMDRLETRTDPLLKGENYRYDNNGNLELFTDRKNQITQFEYDSLNRRKKVTYHSNGATVEYKYDGGNRIREIVDSVSGAILLDYDDLDRVRSETTAQGMVSYTYDAAGRRETMTITGQPTVNYKYDDANRLTRVWQGANTVILDYHPTGRRKSLTLPNGVVQTYTYEADRLTRIDYKKGASMLGYLTYKYDETGNRKEIGGSWGRVEKPTLVAFDPTAYNKANQLTSWNGNALTYDDNGNMTSDGMKTYEWDVRNRLVEIKKGPNVIARFTYDALGRRTSKTINGVKTEYLYDGNDIVAEINGGVVTATYLRGLNIDEPFVRQSGSKKEYYLSDALGSTIALTNDTGAVTTTYSYDPFGNTTVTGTSTNPFQYTGRENDGTGLYYYRARYYSPKLQRFLSNDPLDLSELILLKQGVIEEMGSGGEMTPEDELLLSRYYDILSNPPLQHAYSYVVNNPINYTDPTGEIPPQLIGCLIGAGISIGSDVLGGRKISLLGAGIGCAAGAIGPRLIAELPRLYPPLFHGLNHNPYFRIGYGRFGGNMVPRISVGSRPGGPHGRLYP